MTLYDHLGDFVKSNDETVTIVVYGCERHEIVPFTIADISVQMGEQDAQTLPVQHDNHPTVTIACPLTLSNVDTDGLTIGFATYQMTVSTAADDSSASLVGSHDVVTIRVTLSGPGLNTTPETLDISFKVTIIPACFFSDIIMNTMPEDMSTPVFSFIDQELAPLFTHEHRDLWSQTDKWGADPCIISFLIVGGDTSYISTISVDLAEPDLKTSLFMEPVVSSDVGTHTVQVTAWYLVHTDSAYPLDRELTIGPLSATVEEDCPITSFVNNPAVSTVTSYDYVINSGVETL